MDSRERTSREKDAYDSSDVLEHSTRLLARFFHVFHGPNWRRAEEYLERLMKEKSPGSVVLDYGCGTGWLAPKLAGYGAKKVVGIDASEAFIASAREHFGCQAEFRNEDAHGTSFPDGTFDLVLGRAILHHLDYEVAVREIHRVLKPGGTAAFLEPLRENPAARLVRYLTPKARTLDELPISRKQIRWADRLFGESAHLHVCLVSGAVGAVTSLVSKDPANIAMRVSDRIDVLLARTPLRHWMLGVLLVWRKA